MYVHIFVFVHVWSVASYRDPSPPPLLTQHAAQVCWRDGLLREHPRSLRARRHPRPVLQHHLGLEDHAESILTGVRKCTEVEKVVRNQPSFLLRPLLRSEPHVHETPHGPCAPGPHETHHPLGREVEPPELCPEKLPAGHVLWGHHHVVGEGLQTCGGEEKQPLHACGTRVGAA
jgi:hypothetical protein